MISLLVPAVNKYNNKEILILAFFGLTSLVDSFNGLLISMGLSGFSFGQLYRFLGMAVFLWFVRDNLSPLLAQLWRFMKYFVILNGVFLIIDGTFQSFTFNTITLVKLFFPIVLIEAYRKMKENGSVGNGTLIDKIILVNAWLFPLTLFLPKMLGLGFYTYPSTQSGFKGFFNATNEITFVLVVLFIYVLSMFINTPKIVYLANLGLIAASLALIGTKSGIMFVVAAAFVLILINIRKISLTIMLIFLGITVSAIVVLFFTFPEVFLSNLERQMNFFQGNTIITYLLSGRNFFLEDSINELLLSPYLFLRVLFGAGFYAHGFTKLIEMDFFDLFFAYGFVGVFLIFLYYFNLFKSIKDNNYRFLVMAILIFSFLGGHVIFYALAGTFLAIIGIKSINLKSQ